MIARDPPAPALLLSTWFFPCLAWYQPGGPERTATLSMFRQFSLFFAFFSFSRNFAPFCRLYLIVICRNPQGIPMNHSRNSLSSLRSQLLDLQKLLPALLESSLGREPLLPGSVYTLRRKCGKPSCHCNRGELHESTVLSYRGQTRPQNVSPRPEHVDSLRKMTDHYRRCRQARAELVRWQRLLLKLVDDLQAARVQLGETEFRKLCPAGKPRSSRS